MTVITKETPTKTVAVLPDCRYCGARDHTLHEPYGPMIYQVLSTHFFSVSLRVQCNYCKRLDGWTLRMEVEE